MTKIVVDTSISVSAMLWGGTPQRLLTVAIENSIPLLTSRPLIQELTKTLNKPKLASYVALTGKTPSELAAEFARLMIFVEPADVPPDAVRDPDDVHVLAAAVGGKATHIISGDNDLLVLGSYRDILIMKAIDFIKVIESGDSS